MKNNDNPLVPGGDQDKIRMSHVPDVKKASKLPASLEEFQSRANHPYICTPEYLNALKDASRDSHRKKLKAKKIGVALPEVSARMIAIITIVLLVSGVVIWVGWNLVIALSTISPAHNQFLVQ